MVFDFLDDMRRLVMIVMFSILDEDIELCIEEIVLKVMCFFKVLYVKFLVICIIICIVYELLFLYNCEIFYIY